MAERETVLSLNDPLPVILSEGAAAVTCRMLRGELTSLEDVYISFAASGALVDERWVDIEVSYGRMTIPIGSVGIIRR